MLKTFGQKAVCLSFNSGNDDIDSKCKQIFDAIDQLRSSIEASNSTQMTMIEWKDWRPKPIVINNLV
ncbi:hypothetical protein V2H77_11560 [Photorhabdus sp. P32]|uniref:hypothetical protein n=1 Tax=Photorhabdus sp. P32 TaxID=3117549 RepID=UPI00311B07D1